MSEMRLLRSTYFSNFAASFLLYAWRACSTASFGPDEANGHKCFQNATPAYPPTRTTRTRMIQGAFERFRGAGVYPGCIGGGYIALCAARRGGGACGG